MERLFRVKDIVGDPSKGVRGILPISRSTWWLGVKEGRFPPPSKKLGQRITCWSEADIYKILDI